MRRLIFAAFAAAFLLLTSLQSGALAQTPQAVRMPFRSVNPNYASIKARIDAAHAPAAGGISTSTGVTPTAAVAFQGQSATVFSPSDANGAMGTTEYVQTVNIGVAVYSRSGTLLSTATQSAWTGFANASGDAEVIFSPADQRFYASMLSFNPFTGLPPYYLIYGFSKTASPTAAATDWCFYTSSFGGRYGAKLPDYPKLGQSKDFIMMGVNVFNSATNFSYIGSDVAWVAKPAAGTITTCPSSLLSGVKTSLKDKDGTLAGTPVPANQTDASSTGYVMANEDPNGGTSTHLTMYRVGKSSTGRAVFSAPIDVVVPSYAYPPSAPQQGTADTLDTLDARLTNAILAPDPRLGKLAVWTQHTVAGGAGSEERWYEINAATGALLQSGAVNDPNLYVFMGAVSSDRNGASHKFGSNMVFGFSTSSSTTKPTAAMVSKVGAGAQSPITNVAVSSASNTDFSCTPVCRWGDYAGATPDPASTTAGSVWLTVEMANGGTSNTAAWTTEIWQANP